MLRIKTACATEKPMKRKENAKIAARHYIYKVMSNTKNVEGIKNSLPTFLCLHDTTSDSKNCVFIKKGEIE